MSELIYTGPKRKRRPYLTKENKNDINWLKENTAEGTKYSRQVGKYKHLNQMRREAGQTSRGMSADNARTGQVTSWSHFENMRPVKRRKMYDVQNWDVKGGNAAKIKLARGHAKKLLAKKEKVEAYNARYPQTTSLKKMFK